MSAEAGWQITGDLKAVQCKAMADGMARLTVQLAEADADDEQVDDAVSLAVGFEGQPCVVDAAGVELPHAWVASVTIRPRAAAVRVSYTVRAEGETAALFHALEALARRQGDRVTLVGRLRQQVIPFAAAG
ncbi:MAG: hypothetical protein D6729_17025 [Deltaproteobacteria bacterium]|nr:MAG: hypothetical protein D6729_17025 [Deltaproteobacteria bacterium]